MPDAYAVKPKGILTGSTPRSDKSSKANENSSSVIITPVTDVTVESLHISGKTLNASSDRMNFGKPSFGSVYIY